MKKPLFLFIILSSLTFSEQTFFELWVEGSNGVTEPKHKIGFDSDATLNHDTIRGLELLIPPFDPPGDSLVISSMVFFNEEDGGDVWTRNHFQNFPETDKYYFEYNYRIFRKDITYTIRWDKLAEIADSAIIVDQSGAEIYIADMIRENELVFDNEFVNSIFFTIKVWYNLNSTSVNDKLQIYPIPAQDYIYLKNGIYNNYKIYDLSGNFITSQLLFDNKINISQLTPSVYYLELSNNNNSIVQRFIKQ